MNKDKTTTETFEGRVYSVNRECALVMTERYGTNVDLGNFSYAERVVGSFERALSGPYRGVKSGQRVKGNVIRKEDGTIEHQNIELIQ